MQINTSVDNSIAFEANEVASKDRTEEELEEQASSFAQLLNQTNKTEAVSYHSTNVMDDSITTTFVDPTNGKMVAVELEKDIVSKLEEYFGKDDIRRNQDGSVTLDNKAESYVSGWFEDIAYKRDFLKADLNNDGKLSRDEYNLTKNNFEANIKVTVNSGNDISVSIDESVGTTYINAQETDEFTSLYRSGDRAMSLDDELNKTLSIDKDFNSKVDMTEAYSTNKNISKEELLLAHVNSLSIEDIVRNKASQEGETDDFTSFTTSFNDILSIIIALLLNSDEEKVKESLAKLKENDGDISSLNPMEQNIIEELLKLKPEENGKYNMEEIDKTMELLKQYEIKGHPLKEETILDSSTDKTSV